MNESEINWIERPIIGMALLIFAAPNNELPIDSSAQPIKETAYYRVGKHKTSGKLAIIEINET